MKVLISFAIATYFLVGCVAGGLVPHDDSPGVLKRDAGPALCRDGTTPPCNSRD